MRTKILLAAVLLTFTALTGCKDDGRQFNDEFTLTTEGVTFDGNTLTLGYERQTVAIDMNADLHARKWNAICPIEDLWFSITQRGRQLLVTVTLNNTNMMRSSWIQFSIGDNVQRINVNQDYLRILSFASSSVTVSASRHIESIPLTSNIAAALLSATIDDPAGCDWITGLGVTESALTFTIERNGSVIDERLATLTVQGDGQAASIHVTQNVLSGYPYVIDISGADFSNCYIYEIWDEVHNKKIGELCKEYLYKNSGGTEVVRMQTVVAYAMAGNKIDFSSGLVLENGYFLAWNPNITVTTPPADMITFYDAGESVTGAVNVIYLDEGATRMTTHDIDALPGDRVYATLKPYLLRDKRSGPPNNRGETEEDFSYKVVKIGMQYWMAENLRTTRYRDGDNIPTNISQGAWSYTAATPNMVGHPGCVATTPGVDLTTGATVTAVRYLDANDPAALSTKMEFGVLYNFNAIVRQNTYSGTALTSAQLVDMISPLRWHVPEKAQLEILRRYVSQSTAVTVAIPALAATLYAAAGEANATGFGMKGYQQRGQNGGWNAATTMIASMDYLFSPALTDANGISATGIHLQHTYYCLRMAENGATAANFNLSSAGASSLANNYYCGRAAHYVRCIRDANYTTVTNQIGDLKDDDSVEL